mgnify:FL=1
MGISEKLNKLRNHAFYGIIIKYEGVVFLAQDLQINYLNQLNTDSFIHMLDDTTECYKFYWLDAVLSLFSCGKTEISFDELINQMIVDAWYSVVEYHLHLGSKNAMGEVTNSLERAVLLLEKSSGLSSTASREEIMNAIQEQEKLLKKAKTQLSRNVPYRLLSSFMPNITGNDKIWDSPARVIEVIHEASKLYCFPYVIENAKGLQKTVQINEKWQPFFRDHYTTIHGWIELKKVRYLQGRNPGVPGIVYKLEPENTKLRKLRYVRELWTSVMNLRPVYDIYSEQKMTEENLTIDHFVPWSFVANDELWNLMPMESRLNSSKNNKLPVWDKYFKTFADNQFMMFECVQKKEKVMEIFGKCYRDNLVAPWSLEQLYVSGCEKETFCNVLEKNLRPIYDSAKIQGYGMWTISKETMR